MNDLTLDDIAKELGLSVSTVSRALMGKGRVSEKTHSSVLDAAKRMGYTVNAMARGLRESDSKLIGVIVTEMSNVFFANILSGIQRVCRENGYAAIVCSTEENADMEAEAVMRLSEKRISALIIACVGMSIGEKPFPIVYIDNEPRDTVNCVSVTGDNYKAAFDITRRMMDKGYRRIGMLTGPLCQSSAEYRYLGFRDALRAGGLVLREELVRSCEFSQSSGNREMRVLLDADERPDAMLFASNFIAYGGIRAIRQAGITIPGEIGVAAFDAYDNTGLIEPRIASVNQPAVEIGVKACERALELINGGTVPLRTVLEMSFTDGDSMRKRD